MFGFLKKKPAPSKAKKADAPKAEAAEDAAAPEEDGATPRTPELERKFADRPTNANVAALVHLYFATRLLEWLVRRGIINFGEGVTKSDEAKEIAKANLVFINDLTTAHAKHATDFEEFRVGIQDRAAATTKKLAALLRAADQRVGSPESELAEGLPWPAKTYIAMLLDGFAALFAFPNPETDACKRMRADATPMAGEDAHEAFSAELLDAIARGNGAKSYAFIRMAGFSVAHLSATVEGRENIGYRVSKSIDDHGALDSSLMRFDDVPDDIETKFENAQALFAQETIGLQRRAAAYAAVAAAMLAWMRATICANVDVAVALSGAGVAADADADEDAQAAAQYDKLGADIAAAAEPIIAAEGKVDSVATLNPLREALRQLATALDALAEAGEAALVADGASDDDVAIAKAFAATAATTLGAAAKGEAVLDDRSIPHAEARPQGFEAAVDGLSMLADADADRLRSDAAMAENILHYFSHHAFAAVSA